MRTQRLVTNSLAPHLSQPVIDSPSFKQTDILGFLNTYQLNLEKTKDKINSIDEDDLQSDDLKNSLGHLQTKMRLIDQDVDLFKRIAARDDTSDEHKFKLKSFIDDLITVKAQLEERYNFFLREQDKFTIIMPDVNKILDDLEVQREARKLQEQINYNHFA